MRGRQAGSILSASVLILGGLSVALGSPAQAIELCPANDWGVVLVGTPGPDVLVGTGGVDVIFGRGGADVIRGGGGDDYLEGGPGADTIEGGSCNDTLLGGSGDDELYGDTGDDRLAGDDGVDTGDGGGGNNLCDVETPLMLTNWDFQYFQVGPVTYYGAHCGDLLH